MALQADVERRFAEDRKLAGDYREAVQKEIKGLHDSVAKSSDLQRVEGKLDELLIRNFRH